MFSNWQIVSDLKQVHTVCAVNIFDLNSTGCFKTFIEAKGHFCQFFLRNGSLFVADDPELSIATSPPPPATLASLGYSLICYLKLLISSNLMQMILS